ncbi:hypothetical protein BU25DRAFT_409422 [Macroventuria anomochaeta]|uniref:Uncharacterized protein n=1 Tax=Macroventuria anomochaeta TaxID=301207 RepID=A0ACB6S4F1_9PLEO|nr:uncharacterized protein BU25DRAFT_409422 [Macroventuria anomochaeta]KAF2628924.1 hypothetical protein BU25DRAFT_409422 [Macroventuria anomochaeta]
MRCKPQAVSQTLGGCPELRLNDFASPMWQTPLLLTLCSKARIQAGRRQVRPGELVAGYLHNDVAADMLRIRSKVFCVETGGK